MRTEVLHRVKEEKNVLHTIKEGRVNVLLTSCLGTAFGNTFVKDIAGRIEVMGRRGRGGKWLLDDVKEMRVSWKLNKEALDRTVWRTGSGRGHELAAVIISF